MVLVLNIAWVLVNRTALISIARLRILGYCLNFYLYIFVSQISMQ